ncbi:MAG: hypothetical protein ACJ75S_07900, partial [Solirubrobacterales bacterium]
PRPEALSSFESGSGAVYATYNHIKRTGRDVGALLGLEAFFNPERRSRFSKLSVYRGVSRGSLAALQANVAEGGGNAIRLSRGRRPRSRFTPRAKRVGYQFDWRAAQAPFTPAQHKSAT